MTPPSAIVCDIDGVLADWLAQIRADLQREYGDESILDETGYEIEEMCPPNRPDIKAWVAALFRRAEHFNGMRPYPSAQVALRAIATAGIPILIASDRDKSLGTMTVSWLIRWNFPFTDVGIGRGNKERFARLGVQFSAPVLAIDDNLSKVKTLGKMQNVELWAPKRPYTPEWAEGDERVTVFRDWGTLLERCGITPPGPLPVAR